jgi:phage recombination protein Bet
MTEELQITGDKLDLIKRTVAKGATDDELALFLHTCRRTGLDPLTKQIYCIKRKGQMAIQTGIDGYRVIADRTGKYAGNDDPVFDSEQQPRKASVTVYKIVDGVRCAFTSSARWSQYYPGEGPESFMWKKMPHLMLGKCAEALALRKAFPQSLSGLYVKEEMDQADREEEPKIADRQYEIKDAPRGVDQGHEVAQEFGETIWRCSVLDVTERQPEGKSYHVYTILTDHKSPKQPGTIKKELAEEIGTFIGAGPVELQVKPGRFKGTWEAVSIQAKEEPVSLEQEFAEKEQE